MINTPVTELYNVGLLETMCFQGVDIANYWYMRDGYLHHCGRMTQTFHKKPLNQKINSYLYSSRQWEAV